jgi:hypothetical protein
VLELQGINRMYFESYNCPHNCFNCLNAEYPNGKCGSCRSGFKLDDVGTCSCQTNFNETFYLETLQPDVPDLLFQDDDRVLHSNCISSSQFVNVTTRVRDTSYLPQK